MLGAVCVDAAQAASSVACPHWTLTRQEAAMTSGARSSNASVRLPLHAAPAKASAARERKEKEARTRPFSHERVVRASRNRNEINGLAHRSHLWMVIGPTLRARPALVGYADVSRFVHLGAQ
jgi:hypothetical protein